MPLPPRAAQAAAARFPLRRTPCGSGLGRGLPSPLTGQRVRVRACTPWARGLVPLQGKRRPNPIPGKSTQRLPIHILGLCCRECLIQVPAFVKLLPWGSVGLRVCSQPPPHTHTARPDSGVVLTSLPCTVLASPHVPACAGPCSRPPPPSPASAERSRLLLTLLVVGWSLPWRGPRSFTLELAHLRPHPAGSRGESLHFGGRRLGGVRE